MTDARDYSATLFLPQTDFPMRAGLPQKEPELLERWRRLDMYRRLRRAAAGRPRFILHDGPPYANGNIHIGTALNKILKDVVTRSQQMLGFDSNYVPGWDCHGLPIEWKIEEEYREKGRTRGWSKDASGARGHNQEAVSIIEFRRECRAFADHWIDVQRSEFMRLGVEGDWANRYATMDYPAEAQIARELMKFAMNGTLYRGSKPVMWSVVEQTALAEAEVEYEDYVSDQVWVKFPVASAELVNIHEHASEKDLKPLRQLCEDLQQGFVVIWTTTPWTIPGNRAISFSLEIRYGLYEVVEAPPNNWAKIGERYLIADNLAEGVFRHAKVTNFKKLHDVDFEAGPADIIVTCSHPLKKLGGYDFLVPLLVGDHVTDDAGTGFVHTAPGHGREDFEVWTANAAKLTARGIIATIPVAVDKNLVFTEQAPGFVGKCVFTDKGAKGDANEAVIKALIDAGMLIARGRLRHQYPHSWRSKKPLAMINTPQWFIAMDKAITDKRVSRLIPATKDGPEFVDEESPDTLRYRALDAIKETRWVPPQGENRITGMIESRPDWVISRQRAWGVPITVFVRARDDGSAEVLRDERVNACIADVFAVEGADAWFAPSAAERFLKPDYDPAQWIKVDDILDVWFESGSTHAFTLEVREDLKTRRKRDGGPDVVMYLEGSDQHRGWFQSSLLESCGTRGIAPFDIVLTHGFVLDEHGRKMSKSLGNTVAPQDVMKASGADILRMWACASDYADDLRIGPEILKTSVDTYRRLRNTIRWMLGNLAHFRESDRVDHDAMPQLERLMLHRLAELDALVREAYGQFDYKRIFAALNAFMTVDLSAFYFDVRKDALYCDPISSVTRKACLTVLDHLFRATVTWLAPMLCFTAEEAWLARYPSAEGSVHLQLFPEVPATWRDEALAETWRKVRLVRRVVTGALEIERAAKRIGSSLEAAPVIHVADPDLIAALAGIDMAEVAITSGAIVVEGEGPRDAFRLPDVPGVAVEPRRAEGRKCARSWKILPSVGSDPDYPDVSPRDAQALREWDALRHAAQ
jgi:isoleucyl-tRNA synthetase